MKTLKTPYFCDHYLSQNGFDSKLSTIKIEQKGLILAFISFEHSPYAW
jgi:hypothetical protein